MMWPIARSEQTETRLREEQEMTEDVRRAEGELRVALWQFNEALGQDHVDYAIYSLEAAEKKLDMLLRKAKVLWAGTLREESPQEESRVGIG